MSSYDANKYLDWLHKTGRRQWIKNDLFTFSKYRRDSRSRGAWPCELPLTAVQPQCVSLHRESPPSASALCGFIRFNNLIIYESDQLNLCDALTEIPFFETQLRRIENLLSFFSCPDISFFKICKTNTQVFFFFWENTRLAELSMKETRLAFNNLPAEEEKCYLGCRLRCGRSSPRD